MNINSINTIKYSNAAFRGCSHNCSHCCHNKVYDSYEIISANAEIQKIAQQGDFPKTKSAVDSMLISKKDFCNNLTIIENSESLLNLLHGSFYQKNKTLDCLIALPTDTLELLSQTIEPKTAEKLSHNTVNNIATVISNPIFNLDQDSVMEKIASFNELSDEQLESLNKLDYEDIANYLTLDSDLGFESIPTRKIYSY